MDSRAKIAIGTIFAISVAAFFFMTGFVLGERNKNSEVKALKQQIQSFVDQRRGDQKPLREQLKDRFLEDPMKFQTAMPHMRNHGVAGKVVENTLDEKGNSTILLETLRKDLMEVVITEKTIIQVGRTKGSLDDLEVNDMILVIGRPLAEGEKIMEALHIEKRPAGAPPLPQQPR